MSQRHVAAVIRELAKDPATAHLRVTTIYGVIEFSRANPLTNSLPHTIAPDGTITVLGGRAFGLGNGKD